jgi:hypothetical protein
MSEGIPGKGHLMELKGSEGEVGAGSRRSGFVEFSRSG